VGGGLDVGQGRPAEHPGAAILGFEAVGDVGAAMADDGRQRLDGRRAR
jgi:hypothetical protein